MAQTVRDVMTGNPRSVSPDDTLLDAARIMRDENVGAVLVSEGDRLRGIVTDRDIAIRAVADGMNPSSTNVGHIISEELVTVSPDDAIERAVELMGQRAVRRLPVVEGDRPVGIVALGDLAIERDQESALGQISGAPSNT